LNGTATSAPLTAGSSLSPVARSAATRRAPSAAASGLRVTTTTSCLSACSRGTTARPSTPVPPVTVTLATLTLALPRRALSPVPARTHTNVSAVTPAMLVHSAAAILDRRQSAASRYWYTRSAAWWSFQRGHHGT
jgi:hypothetical protein